MRSHGDFATTFFIHAPDRCIREWRRKSICQNLWNQFFPKRNTITSTSVLKTVVNLPGVMKKILALLFAITVLTGCKTSYDVTLSDGKKITGVSKPVLDETKGQYQFKTADGQGVKVPASRIRLIEPHGESSAKEFVSPTQKK
jgi:hypothetical protein